MNVAMLLNFSDRANHDEPTPYSIMIYLLDRMPPGDKITLIRPQPGGLEPKCIYIGKLQASLDVLNNVILFAHAFTGTDTTSAAYRRGKA